MIQIYVYGVPHLKGISHRMGMNQSVLKCIDIDTDICYGVPHLKGISLRMGMNQNVLKCIDFDTDICLRCTTFKRNQS